MQSSFYTETLTQSKLLHTEAFARRSFYTQNLLHRKLLHKGSFTQTQKKLYTEKLLHGESVTRRKLSHRASFYTKNLYTQKLLHRETVTQSKLYTEQGFTQRSFHTKTAFPPRRQSGRTTILKHFLKEFQSKIISAKVEKNLLPKHHSQPSRSHYNTLAAKDTSITQAAAAARNLNTSIPLRSADTRLQDTIELCTAATQVAAPKPYLDAKAEKR